jgi:hypothetical protein
MYTSIRGTPHRGTRRLLQPAVRVCVVSVAGSRLPQERGASGDDGRCEAPIGSPPHDESAHRGTHSLALSCPGGPTGRSERTRQNVVQRISSHLRPQSSFATMGRDVLCAAILATLLGCATSRRMCTLPTRLRTVFLARSGAWLPILFALQTFIHRPLHGSITRRPISRWPSARSERSDESLHPSSRDQRSCLRQRL